MHKETILKKRQPVVAIMGHVDHGKSSLLDAIRNTNLVENEIGGITQQISAYEISHSTKDKKRVEKITFLDTPGHEAFTCMRECGAKIADIAVLIVSGEDGVKEQTIDAFNTIKENNLQLIVAISKVDKPSSDIIKTKNSLIENGIYIEGMGGDIPFVEIDSKTKKGIDELLETILLVSDLEDFKYDDKKFASGYVLETFLDKKRGISSTLVIKDGILPKNGSILAGTAISPIRIVEDFLGKPITNPVAGQVVKITGFDAVPEINSSFISNTDKKEIEILQKKEKENIKKEILDPKLYRNAKLVIPIILKTDGVGTYNSIEKELRNLEYDKKTKSSTGVKIKIVGGGIGNITENDILVSSHDQNILIIGFNVNIENNAKIEADRLNIKPTIFDIVYKLSEWFQEIVENRLPHEEIELSLGKLKILKSFSTNKDKQVLGGEVKEGVIKLGKKVKIIRRDFNIGIGKVIELQSMKIKTEEVLEGNQCGIMIESKIEIIPGDIIECIEIEKRKII